MYFFFSCSKEYAYGNHNHQDSNRDLDHGLDQFDESPSGPQHLADHTDDHQYEGTQFDHDHDQEDHNHHEEEQHEDDGQLSGMDDAPNEFEVLQLQREKEFMDYLCEPLADSVPEEYAQHIEADLAERLRQTVNIYLSDKRITDVDSLDNYLVEFLGLEQLRLDMESTRDDLMEHLMADHMQYEEDGGAAGEEQHEQYSEYGNKGEGERKRAAAAGR